MPRAITFFAILLAGLGALVSKVPHLRLAAQLASGELQGEWIPVSDFAPTGFQETSQTLRTANLVFEAPQSARVEQIDRGGSIGLQLQQGGLMCYVLPPRTDAEDDESDPWPVLTAPGKSQLDDEAAICAASERDFSLWMSADEVEQLREQLELRPTFRLNAERVEVVRGHTLSGLLLTWKVEGATHMAFNYASPDQHIRGHVLLRLESESPQVMQTARAMVSSFRLQAE